MPTSWTRSVNRKWLFVSSPKVKRSETQSEGIYEEYDDVYEQYGQEDAKNDTEVRKENVNGDEEKVYEQYDDDYEPYNSRYANYSKVSNTNRQEIFRKLADKKWVMLFVISLLAICGIAVGLSIHFTAPQTTTKGF